MVFVEVTLTNLREATISNRFQNENLSFFSILATSTAQLLQLDPT